MEWNLSETIALAAADCVHCQGLGMYPGRRQGKEYPCECVFRAIFRACYARFRICVETEKRMSHVQLEWSAGSCGKRFYSRKIEEYIADFCSLSRRSLDPEEYKIFRVHFLLGADWKVACPYLHIDKGIFFHGLYQIEKKLGRAFRDTEPYGLFPLDEYFGGVVRKARRSTRVERILRKSMRTAPRPPLKKIA